MFPQKKETVLLPLNVCEVYRINSAVCSPTDKDIGPASQPPARPSSSGPVAILLNNEGACSIAYKSAINQLQLDKGYLLLNNN